MDKLTDILNERRVDAESNETEQPNSAGQSDTNGQLDETGHADETRQPDAPETDCAACEQRVENPVTCAASGNTHGHRSCDRCANNPLMDDGAESPREHRNCGLCRIEMRDVSVKRGNQVLLSDINLHIHCGELTALVGENGAGKTTLLRALMGIIPYAGAISHIGGDEKPFTGVRVGYVPQHLDVDVDMPISVCDLVGAALSGARAADIERGLGNSPKEREGKYVSLRPAWLGFSRRARATIKAVLAQTNCERLMNERISSLSGGEMQRVQLALALTPMPELLILDEPISGMDQNGVDMFYSMVGELQKKHHMAILLVSHDFEMVRRHADRVVMLNKSIQCEGSPDEVFASEPFVRAFGKIELTDKMAGGEIDAGNI